MACCRVNPYEATLRPRRRASRTNLGAHAVPQYSSTLGGDFVASRASTGQYSLALPTVCTTLWGAMCRSSTERVRAIGTLVC